jgi:hypothetical protein
MIENEGHLKKIKVEIINKCSKYFADSFNYTEITKITFDNTQDCQIEKSAKNYKNVNWLQQSSFNRGLLRPIKNDSNEYIDTYLINHQTQINETYVANFREKNKTISWNIIHVQKNINFGAICIKCERVFTNDIITILNDIVKMDVGKFIENSNGIVGIFMTNDFDVLMQKLCEYVGIKHSKFTNIFNVTSTESNVTMYNIDTINNIFGKTFINALTMEYMKKN